MPADGTHDDLDTDPIPLLHEKAVRLHEIHQALVKAGFSRVQADGFVAELVSETFAENFEDF